MRVECVPLFAYATMKIQKLKFLIFCQFSAFKEIVESDTFFGGLGESWLEEGLKEKVAGDLWYFLSYSLLKIFTDILFITSGILFSPSQVFSFNISSFNHRRSIIIADILLIISQWMSIVPLGSVRFTPISIKIKLYIENPPSPSGHCPLERQISFLLQN